MSAARGSAEDVAIYRSSGGAAVRSPLIDQTDLNPNAVKRVSACSSQRPG